MKIVTLMMFLFVLGGCAAKSGVVPICSDSYRISRPAGKSTLAKNLINCGGKLTNIAIDRYNCGNCEKVCTSDQVCDKGSCVACLP